MSNLITAPEMMTSAATDLTYMGMVGVIVP